LVSNMPVFWLKRPSWGLSVTAENRDTLCSFKQNDYVIAIKA
jgi:hypothetical protein